MFSPSLLMLRISAQFSCVGIFGVMGIQEQYQTVYLKIVKFFVCFSLHCLPSDFIHGFERPILCIFSVVCNAEGCTGSEIAPPPIGESLFDKRFCFKQKLK